MNRGIIIKIVISFVLCVGFTSLIPADTVKAWDSHECGYGCSKDSDCPSSTFDNGAYKSICSQTLHICVNPLCPNTQASAPAGVPYTRLGAQCQCDVSIGKCGDKCGIWKNGFYPLCPDSSGSSCSWINGPSCYPSGGSDDASYDGGTHNTYCVPDVAQNGYTKATCTNDNYYQYLISPPPGKATSGHTQADVVAACNCQVVAPGMANLTFPADQQIFTTSSTQSITFTYDITSTGWGSGCPMAYNSSLFVSVNGGAYTEYKNQYGVGVPSNTISFSVNSTVKWYVTKNNGGASSTSATNTFYVQPPCTTSAPGLAALTSPLNNSTVTLGAGDSVNLAYDPNANGWGVNCPSNNNSYVVQVSAKCSGVYKDFGSTTQLLGLSRGTSYCWRVFKSNGSTKTSTSAVFKFTTLDDSTQVISSGIPLDVCKNGFSGAFGTAGVSNPVDFNLSFKSSVSGNEYKEVWLAMVPDNDDYNKRCPSLGGNVILDAVCKNMESLPTQTESLLLPKVKNANTFAAKLILDTTGKPTQAWVYNGSTWNKISTAGSNVTGLGATLMDFLNTSTASVTGTDLTSNFRIKFDTGFPLGKFSFYIAALYKDPAGNLKTSYSDLTSSFVYKRVNASATRTNWGVDVNPPAAAGFGNAKYTAADTFQMNWQFNEPNGLQLKSYITSDVTDSVLTDKSPGGGNINLPATLPDVAKYNSGELNYSSLSGTNGYVDETIATNPDPNIRNRTYQDADPTKQSNYLFYAFTKDLACNQKAISATAFLQKPWVLGYNGGISANAGVVGISIPNGLNSLSSDLSSSSGSLLTDRNSVFLTTNSALSGTTDLPLRKQSKLSEYDINYEDSGALPPTDSGYHNWYDYMYNTVNNNTSITKATIVTKTGNIVLGGNTSTFLGVAAGTRAHVVINGNLTVNANTNCDTKTIFFINGNSAKAIDTTYPNTSLKIIPNVTTSSNANGCIFVSAKDILIDNGGQSTSLDVNDSALANYDVLNAALMTDGKFVTLADKFGTTKKADGLFINGTVTSFNVNLQRDINLNANQLQPAHVFQLDPRYRELFKTDLNYIKYSIREIGYTGN